MQPNVSDAVLDEGLEAISVEECRETILRRVTLAACVAALIAIACTVMLPEPIHAGVMSLTVAVLLALLAICALPPGTPILSRVYPWAAVGLSIAIVGCMGPRVDGMLLLASGLFVGGLALGMGSLMRLLVVALVGFGVAMWAMPVSVGDARIGLITSSACALVGVVVPSAIAGRMMVGALTKTLHQREVLVRRVIEESRQLEATRAQLTQAQKLELMSQMAGGIAHDMNNALTTVIGEASLLDDDQAEPRAAILEAGRYAADLTQQLMVFGRHDVSRPRVVDLSAAVQDALRAIRRTMPSDIEVSERLPDRPVTVVADPTQLLQVLLNLATNAKDAMPDGGELEMSVSQDGPMASLAVRDTGTGIPADVRSLVFDPFFTTKPEGEGTGLGLANVKQLVEGLGGSVELDSEPGHGTTFTLRLPASSSEPDPVELPRPTPRPTGGAVLVVDDDVRIRAVVFTALQRAGYRVLEAATPAAALEVAQKEDGQIDLLLTDVVMAGGGGVEAIRLVRGVAPRVRILVMSGYNDDEAIRRGVELGELPFLTKPFTVGGLVRAVGAALTDVPIICRSGD